MEKSIHSTEIKHLNLYDFSRGSLSKREEYIKDIDASLRGSGFFYVSHHGVSETLIKAIKAVSTAFFSQPAHKKMEVLRPGKSVARGYTPVGSESLSYSMDLESPPDLNESFQIGPLKVPADPYFHSDAAWGQFAPNLWPDSPREFKAVWEEYFGSMERLSHDLMRLFSLALGISENFFDTKTDRHIGRLRARNYPAVTCVPLDGQLRAGAHTDYGTLAILLADELREGLQYFDRTQGWTNVPAVSGSFIVNLGDLMQRWTNDRWIAPVHRVANPAFPDAMSNSRLTHIFFHAPNYDTIVDPRSILGDCAEANYQPVTTVEHIRTKLEKARKGS